MKPQITIGISFKNPGKYFRLALQSIFAQTFTTNWELILVDDGSTDDSLILVKSLEDERVYVYSDGQSKGLNVRLNQMIQLANAPYFVRMDADDIMHPQRLEKQYGNDLLPEGEITADDSASVIAEGGAAATAYSRLQFEEMNQITRQKINAALLRYCELDTLAMVMITQAWQAVN